ncbi:hypothetical protein CBL_12155 [Carabus blaptoides fortunei]
MVTRLTADCLNMAASDDKHASCSSQTGDTSEYDASLDFCSEHFNPLKALYAPNIIIPVPNARVYDNLAKYESVQRGVTVGKKVREETAPSSNFQRKFLPHQSNADQNSTKATEKRYGTDGEFSRPAGSVEEMRGSANTFKGSIAMVFDTDEL